MTTDDKAMHEPTMPDVLVEGPPPFGNFGAQWIVRLYVNGHFAGTGFVLNRHWILTARHVVQDSPTQKLAEVQANLRQNVSMYVLDTTVVTNPNEGVTVIGGKWLDNVLVGTGDMAALHVKPNHQATLAGRDAPVYWGFDPDRYKGTNVAFLGFSDKTANLAEANGQIVGTTKGQKFGGREVVVKPIRGQQTQPGDSGGPVMADVPDIVGRQVVGINVGVPWGTLLTLFGKQRNQLFVSLKQGQDLLEKINEMPEELEWVPPGDPVAGNTATGTRVAVCSYRVTATYN